MLEPFSNEPGLGANAGQTEVDTLTKAGFGVDVVRNQAVTVDIMEGLSQYSAVYMETHSGILPDGDAIITTGQLWPNGVATTPLAPLYADKSIEPAIVSGDPALALYTSITAHFISAHMGQFPANSMVFLNGCSVLNATRVWDALHAHNVRAYVSWDNDVYSNVDMEAANFMFDRLLQGDTLANAISATQAAGLGTSEYNGTTSHFGFQGDGMITFSDMLTDATPTATPIPTPVVSATAASKHRALHCKRGWHAVHSKCQPKHKPQKCKKHRVCKGHGRNSAL